MNDDDNEEVFSNSEDGSEEASDLWLDDEGVEYTREEWVAAYGTEPDAEDEEETAPEDFPETGKSPPAPKPASLAAIPASPLFTAEEEAYLAQEQGMTVEQLRQQNLIMERVALRAMNAGFIANSAYNEQAKAAPALFDKHGTAIQAALLSLPPEQRANPKAIRLATAAALLESGPENETLPQALARLAREAGQTVAPSKARPALSAGQKTPIGASAGRSIPTPAARRKPAGSIAAELGIDDEELAAIAKEERKILAGRKGY